MPKAKPDLRAQILGSKGQRFRREPVEIEGVDAKLYVREISAARLQALADSLSPEQMAAAENGGSADAESFRTVGRFLVAGLVGEDGEPVFQDGDEDEIMDAFSVPELITLQRQFMALNRVGQEPGAEKND